MRQMVKKLQNAYNAFEKGRMKQAEILFLECVDKIDDRESPAYKQALHGFALVKSELGNYPEARELYLEILRIAESVDNKEEEAIAYHQLGMVERLAGQYEKALRFLSTEAEIYKTLNGDFHLELAANVYEKGMIYLLNKQYEQARNLMEKSLYHAEQAYDPMIIGYAYRGLGDIFSQSDEKEAKNFYQQAIIAFKWAEDNQAVEAMKDKISKL
ncbi:MAG TPA: tetratricopeptide repeat protein [Candidatus Avamphibacillus sp.]|nr:tetratricopeptide repeat protein [Candidatus Avamphibacillus sp.]